MNQWQIAILLGLGFGLGLMIYWCLYAINENLRSVLTELIIIKEANNNDAR